MMIDIDMSRVNKLLKKAKDNNYLSGFDFSLLIQDLTISEGGYKSCLGLLMLII